MTLREVRARHQRASRELLGPMLARMGRLGWRYADAGKDMGVPVEVLTSWAGGVMLPSRYVERVRAWAVA